MVGFTHQCEPPARFDEELSFTARITTPFLSRLSGSRKTPSSGPGEKNHAVTVARDRMI